MFVDELEKGKLWRLTRLVFSHYPEVGSVDGVWADYNVAYCDDCYQYFRLKCRCKVPKVLIQSTGEVL